MSHIGPETFLDLLTLSIVSPLPEFLNREQVTAIVKKSLEHITEIMQNETIYNTDENKFFLGVCNEVIEEHISILNKTKLGIATTKWLSNFPLDEDSPVKKIFTDIVMADDPATFQEKHIYEIFDRSKQLLSVMMIEKEMTKMRAKVKKATRTSDIRNQQILVEDILGNAKKMMDEVKGLNETVSRSINIESIDFMVRDSVKHALKTFHLVRKVTVFKVGLQGFNDMLTEDHGLVLGETVLLAALSHHYKSGMLMDIARAIAMYNEPPRLDDLEPAIVLISLENEGHKNLMNLFRRAYANEYGCAPPAEMTFDEISDKVIELFSRKGWRLIILRRIGELFTFEDYVKLHEDLKKRGIRVYVNIIDYPGKMNLGLLSDIEGSAGRAKGLERLFHRFCNFAKHDNFLNVFAHQLDTNAASIVASKIPNPILKFHGRYHLQDGKSVYNEVDLLVFMCKEYNTIGIPFQTFMWGKHRDNTAPPPEKQFFAYPFTPLGIMDDINDAESKAIRDIFSYRPNLHKYETAIEDESIFN